MAERNISRILLILLIVFCLSACGKNDQTGSGREYTIYYTNLAGTSFVEKKYKPEADRFEGILKELIEQFTNAPYSDASSALPMDVEINGYIMGVDALQVDFNAAYLGISNVQEIMLRAGLVKTLIQLPGVTRVGITVEGQPLRDSDGREVSYMNEDTFIDNQGNGINSYHYITLDLYFSNASGDKVVREMRNVYYSSNLTVEKVIVEQILQGPVNGRLLPVADPSVLVNSVTISKDICVVDLDSKFNQVYQAAVQPETTLYAFVNSICDACSVKGVRFEINGESDVRYRGVVNLDQVFERNADVIEPSVVTEAASGVVQDTESEDAVLLQQETVGQIADDHAGRKTFVRDDLQYHIGAQEEQETEVQTEGAGTNSSGAEPGVGLDPVLVQENKSDSE